jgi:hypothetical protein
MIQRSVLDTAMTVIAVRQLVGLALRSTVWDQAGKTSILVRVQVRCCREVTLGEDSVKEELQLQLTFAKR